MNVQECLRKRTLLPKSGVSLSGYRYKGVMQKEFPYNAEIVMLSGSISPYNHKLGTHYFPKFTEGFVE